VMSCLCDAICTSCLLCGMPSVRLTRSLSLFASVCLLFFLAHTRARAHTHTQTNTHTHTHRFNMYGESKLELMSGSPYPLPHHPLPHNPLPHNPLAHNPLALYRVAHRP
jgi:hypothetical protein